ncbi:MAG: hypothetical protein SF052_23720 [Bacteroidia bacterium]|nr:hypothetical protein [Bacteroidia bacterium]
MKQTKILLNTALAVMFCAVLPLRTYSQEVSREIQRTFTVKPGMTLYVTNRQGNIHIDTWDKPEVRLTAKISLTGPNTDVLEERLEVIKINATASDTAIKIENQSPSGSRMIWASPPSNKPYVLNLQSFSGTGSEKTDFQLTVPRTLKMKIDHQYGDVFLGNTDALLDLSLRHGSIKGDILKGKNKLTFIYANGSIKQLGKATIEAQKSQLHILGAQRLDIHSAYSEFEIDQADSLISSHKHNEFEIKNVGYLKMDEDYSEVNVFHLLNEGDFRFNYGDLKLDWVAPDFTYLNLTGELSDFDVKVDTTAEFSLEIDSDLTDIHIPEDVIILNKKDIPQVKTLRLHGVKGLENLRTIKPMDNIYVKDKTRKRIVIITKNGEVILK